MKRVLSIAAFLVAISLAGSQTFGIDDAHAKRIKKAVSGATLPEMPGVVAQLVTQASTSDREEVALTAVQAAVYKSPSSAPMVVAAISKAAPDLTDVVTKKTIQLQPALSSTVVASDRAASSGRGSVVAAGGFTNPNAGSSGFPGQATSSHGNGVATGHFDPSFHNPGPPLPDSPPHHNRPPHPLGGPPGLIDYSRPRPHH